jgi:hypothetical protein
MNRVANTIIKKKKVKTSLVNSKPSQERLKEVVPLMERPLPLFP